jgi:signal transduction histidine kinase/ligand-binding sensor domain-containing protein/DNA-binding response OmpR family regulator
MPVFSGQGLSSVFGPISFLFIIFGVIIWVFLEIITTNTMYRRNICMLFLCIFNFFGFAQTPEYRFNHLTTSDGFSNNNIRAIFMDRDGFMWFGTTYGLNRYDGTSIRIFTHSRTNPFTIADNFINNIAQDPEGMIWIGHRRGFSIYNPLSEVFENDIPAYFAAKQMDNIDIKTFYSCNLGNFYIVGNQDQIYHYKPVENKLINLDYLKVSDLRHDRRNTVISNIRCDNSGNLWIIYNTGLLHLLDPVSCKVIYTNEGIQKLLEGQRFDFGLFADRENNLWVYMHHQSKGVYYLDPNTEIISHITTESQKPRLSNNTVAGIIQDQQGLIWIATDHGGINLIDPETMSVKYIRNNPSNRYSIADNALSYIYKDRNNLIWIGTYKSGISYYHRNMVRFPLLKSMLNEQPGLSFDDINCFAEDELGNLWIGSNGGGLIYYNRQNGGFTTFMHDPHNPTSLSNNVVVSLLIDHQGVLWVGTYHGGLCRYVGNGRFQRFRHDPADPRTISDDKVWSLFEDSGKTLWIGTLSSGLDTLDRRTGSFNNLRSRLGFIVHSNSISVITQDRDKNLWVGTADGISKIDYTGRTSVHYFPDPGNPGSLSHDLVNCILSDSRGWIWAGTNDGLNLYIPSDDSFRHFTRENGLPDNLIKAIEEDRSGNLWVATTNGMAQIIIDQIAGQRPENMNAQIFTYDDSDGLQNREFNVNASILTSRGEIVFGGVGGMNIFLPENIERNENSPDIRFTGLHIFNQEVRPGEKLNNRTIIPVSITQNPDITLHHSHNVFTIEFSALNYINPSRNLYAYKLEGFNKEWTYITGTDAPRVTYTNLDPGSYIFRVRASNNDGVWNEEGISLKIKILPPFWSTPFAYALYVAVLIFILWFARYMLLQKERMNFRIEQQKQESERMHQMDNMKIRFFTNMSHEFRTPLSLIISPVEGMMNETTDELLKQKLELVYRNARRLLSMINQLLDFRRMEVQEINLNPVNDDIVKFLKETTYSFSDLSERKNMQLTFFSSFHEFYTSFDPDKLEKIMFNLLSNAFKFTPEKGSVRVSVEFDENNNGTPKSKSTPKHLLIKVSDSGIGVAAEKHEKIFERFFQDNSTMAFSTIGSGIGLSLTREFVRLHGGTIKVESTPGTGSTFIVKLPVETARQVVIPKTPLKEEIQLPDTLNFKEPQIDLLNNDGKPLVLLVEDNDDFRFYLKDNLRKKFRVIEAKDGYDGFFMAEKYLPDLMISDVMMQGMDGFELCEKVKKSPATSHIPVVLTTAQASNDFRITGYNAGADAFLVKPFSLELLFSRIKNLLAQLEKSTQSWGTLTGKNQGHVPAVSLDDKFLKKAIDLVEENISNSSFSVTELSKGLHVSRVHLYKKLIALTGKSPTDFIRIIRMKKAAYLLKKTQLSISEVCFEVGYNNPKYFSSHFKKEFNTNPSDYKKHYMSRKA